MYEVGTIQWKLATQETQIPLRTTELRFTYRDRDAPVDDSRGLWTWGTAEYNWDSSKTAFQIEKEIQNICRAKVGIPPLP